VERCRGKAVGVESPLGWVPRFRDIDWTGLSSFKESEFIELMTIDHDQWYEEISSQNELFLKLYDR
jgi:phosphoenolpyruvate carboxykinase (GTP)